MFKVASSGYVFEVQPAEDYIQFSLTKDDAVRAILLTRDEARMLHTDLGEMLGRFEVADVGQAVPDEAEFAKERGAIWDIEYPDVPPVKFAKPA